MEEKRKYPRLESSLEVEYYPTGRDTLSNYTVSKNISRKGMCIPVMPRLVKDGDTIKLDIHLHDNSGIVSAVGKVRWIKQIKRPAVLGQEAGIEFTDISPHDSNRLVNF